MHKNVSLKANEAAIVLRHLPTQDKIVAAETEALPENLAHVKTVIIKDIHTMLAKLNGERMRATRKEAVSVDAKPQTARSGKKGK